MRIKRLVWTAVWALAWLALSAGLLLLANRVRRETTGVSLRIGDTAVAERRLESAMAEEDGALRLTAAWSRGRTEAIGAPALGTTAQARPIAVYGDVRQVCSMRLLSGSYPVEGDTAGCLVSADVAMALFHSVDAIGAQALVGEREYTVRGIVAAYESMVILRSDAADYENLEFATDNLSGGAAEAEAFLYRHGLSGDYVIVQGGLYARMLYGLALLPPVLGLVLTGLRFLSAFLRNRKRAAALVYLVPAAAALLLAAWLGGRAFYWPQGYLPTKCSDFAFWRALFTGWREAWKAMTLMTPLPKDIQLFQAARVLVCGVLAALAIEAGLYRRLGRTAGKICPRVGQTP